MTHTPAPQFLVFEEGIINVHDISSAVPEWTNRDAKDADAPDGVRVTFMSKGTSLFLSGQTIKGFESRLNGAVF